MRIISPNGLAGSKGNNPPNRPDWYAEWLKDRGKYVRLECGCIEDVHIPACVTLLTGKRIFILCPYNHGFQAIKKTLTLRDVLLARGIPVMDTASKLIPPF